MTSSSVKESTTFLVLLTLVSDKNLLSIASIAAKEQKLDKIVFCKDMTI